MLVGMFAISALVYCQRNSLSTALIFTTEGPFRWQVTALSHRLISLSSSTNPHLLSQVLPHQGCICEYHVSETNARVIHLCDRKISDRAGHLPHHRVDWKSCYRGCNLRFHLFWTCFFFSILDPNHSKPNERPFSYPYQTPWVSRPLLKVFIARPVVQKQYKLCKINSAQTANPL